MASSNTARLRRTFHYPNDDSDNDSQPDAMDEQGTMPRPTLYVYTEKLTRSRTRTIHPAPLRTKYRPQRPIHQIHPNPPPPLINTLLPLAVQALHDPPLHLSSNIARLDDIPPSRATTYFDGDISDRQMD